MAKANIDVYKDWLGIQESNRPLTYYQLLRLKPFEDNVELIRKNYRDLNAHVRKFAAGDYMAESQALLNELAKVMLCLTDSARKLEYDISLGRKVETQKVRRTLEEILVSGGIIPAEKMKPVKNYSNATGIDLHEAVLQQKLAAPEIVMLAYAESIGLPFVSLSDIGVDEDYAPQINPNTARQHSFVPLMVDHGQLLLTSPRPVNPDVEEELRMLFGMPVRSTICTQSEISAAIAKYYPRDAVQLVRKKDGGTTTVAAQPAATKSGPTKAESSEPMTDEEKKNRLLTSIVAFNFTVLGVCMGLYYGVFPNAGLVQASIIAVCGLTVGGIAALVAWNKLSH